jgi:hypothetical protein
MEKSIKDFYFWNDFDALVKSFKGVFQMGQVCCQLTLLIVYRKNEQSLINGFWYIPRGNKRTSTNYYRF